MSKPHDIDFFVILPDKNSVDAVADEMVRRGYGIVGAEMSDSGKEYTLHAFKRLVPELAEIRKITRDLSSLAAAHGGHYDGWGAPVVK